MVVVVLLWTILKFLLNLLHHCFYFMFWDFDCEACGIFTPWPGIEPISPALEDEVLTTGPPGKSQEEVFPNFYITLLEEGGLCMFVCVCVLVASVMSDSLWLCKLGPPGSSVSGILQARILEWFAISSSRGSSRPRDRTLFFRTAGILFIIWGTREG